MRHSAFGNTAARAAALRVAMRGFASTVTIITTCWEGRRYGMTATSVTAVSMDPPALLMCVNRSGQMHGVLAVSGIACVNVLTVRHADLCKLFSHLPGGEQRFCHGRWEAGALGLPYLADAQANVAVRISKRLSFGSHEIFVGEVEHIRTDSLIAPLVYVDGSPATVAGKFPA